MKVKANIEIWDDSTREELDASEFTNENIKNLYEIIFKSILAPLKENSSIDYSVNVEVVEE